MVTACYSFRAHVAQKKMTRYRFTDIHRQNHNWPKNEKSFSNVTNIWAIVLRLTLNQFKTRQKIRLNIFLLPFLPLICECGNWICTNIRDNENGPRSEFFFRKMQEFVWSLNLYVLIQKRSHILTISWMPSDQIS